MSGMINKYRPTKFNEVIGQDSAVRSMRTALSNTRAHTFLLTGPSGCGKTTLARIAAKEVGCHKNDVIEINGTVTTGIDDVRQILSMTEYKPMHGEASAIIVDEFHGLSKQAVSALLKATEEPPTWLYWFIATTEPTKIPVAIKTRAVHISLKPVRDELLIDLLNEIADQERIKVSKDILKVCVSEAMGSPRQAISNLVAVADIKSLDAAKEALASAQGSTEAIDLAKLLVGGRGSFSEVQQLLLKMRDSNQNPESVRQTIRAYVTAVALKANGGFLQKQLAVLEEFSQPFNPMDQLTPLLLGCARLMLSKGR